MALSLRSISLPAVASVSTRNAPKPAVFRDRTFDSNSVSSDKVCDKVSGKGRVKWDLSGFKISKLQGLAPRGRRGRPRPRVFSIRRRIAGTSRPDEPSPPRLANFLLERALHHATTPDYINFFVRLSTLPPERRPPARRLWTSPNQRRRAGGWRSANRFLRSWECQDAPLLCGARERGLIRVLAWGYFP